MSVQAASMKVIKIVLGKKGLCVHVCARYLYCFEVVLAGHTKIW